ncbi:MAG: hypothetical protein WCR31_04675 [Treponema sp.]
MEITYIVNEKAGREPLKILTDFMRTLPAVVKYGKTILYEGETVYLPYLSAVYEIVQTKEKYTFICSCTSRDIAVLSGQRLTEVSINRTDADDDSICPVSRTESDVLEEIETQIKLDPGIRKTAKNYHMNLISTGRVYLRETVFYAKGRKNYIFPVDPLQEKVDFQNAGAVNRHIAEIFVRQHPEILK